MIKTIFYSALGVAALGAAVVGLNEFGFRLDQHYQPAYEDIRRETYEHSRAFNEGTIRDLQNLQLEYARGNDAQKDAVRSIARERLADIDLSRLPVSLRSFARDMESVQ